MPAFILIQRPRRWLLMLAALCMFALPGLMAVKQAQAGELLQMLCTTEGKKAVAGMAGSHDCPQCCATSGPPAAAITTTCPTITLREATPANQVPHAVLNAAYLTPAATGPPRLI
jgi:hypothetical protein